MTLTLNRPWREWLPILGLWAGAVALSTAQIYVRELAFGYSTPWTAVLWANCLAWSPWLAIVPLALGVERRFPLSGRRRLVHALLHGGVACAVSATFLLYLTLFHWNYLGGRAFPGNLAGIQTAYFRKLDQFFLTAALLYGTIVVIGLAARSLRQSRAERRPDSAPAAPPALVIRSVGRVERVDPAAVDWIEGCGNYARLHVDGRSKLIRRTLASLAEELGPARFARIHRSAIVNVERVVELRRLSHGEAALVLRNGRKLKVSRTYRPALEQLAR